MANHARIVTRTAIRKTRRLAAAMSLNKAPWPGNSPDDERWCCSGCQESLAAGAGLLPGHFACTLPPVGAIYEDGPDL